MPNKRENYNYSTETECITRITHDDFRNNNWKNVSTEEFVASKEYHFTRMPKSLTLTKDTLRWKEPERIKDLTGYKNIGEWHRNWHCRYLSLVGNVAT